MTKCSAYPYFNGCSIYQKTFDFLYQRYVLFSIFFRNWIVVRIQPPLLPQIWKEPIPRVIWRSLTENYWKLEGRANNVETFGHYCCSTQNSVKTYEPRHKKTCLWEFPTRSDSNWPAQLQKLARVLKFWLYNLHTRETVNLYAAGVL